MLILKTKNEKKSFVADFKCWGCISEINIGCNKVEGDSNPHRGIVNADVKNDLESLVFAGGYKN